MAITIMLCSTGVLPIYLGIALVMGENIGTTATANLAALGAGIEARRAALAHLLFNVFGVVWVIAVFYSFVDIVCGFVGYDVAVGGQAERLPVVLAMFHTCFNLANTAILVGFVPQIERAVCWLMPAKKQSQRHEFKLQNIRTNLVQTPEISVLQAQKEVARFADNTHQMFCMVQGLFTETNAKRFTERFDQIEHEEDMSDRMELEIARYLEQVSDDHLSDETKHKIRQMMREIGELESIGDACYHLARTLSRLEQTGKTFAAQQVADLQAMMALCDQALRQMCITMHGHRDEHDIRDTFHIENQINAMRDRLKRANITAVNEHQYDYTLGTIFGDLISSLERLGDYVVNVVEARFGK